MYASDPEDRKSISGYSVEVEDTTVAEKCVGQDGVTLSVCEAETVAGMQCVQEMLFVKKELESIETEVKLPMILRIDCKGAVDLANSWSIGGQTRHIETKQWFLRELKERGIVKVVWIRGENNPADLFMKNLPKKAFEKHRGGE
jgi:hypothetical protein